MADFECRFLCDSYGRTEHHFGPFWEKDFGAISGGPFFSRRLCFTAEMMTGWHGMENGQKPEMEKKKKRNRNGKRPQAGQGQKWPKHGPKMEKSFFGHFLPFLPVSSLGPFSISISIFFHFRLLAGFHAIPARQDPNFTAEMMTVCANNFRSCLCKVSSISPLNSTGSTQKEFEQIVCAIRF